MSASLLTPRPARDVRELILTTDHADGLALQGRLHAARFGHVLDAERVHCTRCTWTIRQHAEHCTHETLYVLVGDVLPLVVR